MQQFFFLYILAKGQKLPLPSGNHSIVLIINDYSYYELREKIKLENSRAFKDEILAKIDDAGLSAVIFDNLYPVCKAFYTQ